MEIGIFACFSSIKDSRLPVHTVNPFLTQSKTKSQNFMLQGVVYLFYPKCNKNTILHNSGKHNHERH